MSEGILVFIEERQSVIKKPSLEALSAARGLADTLSEPVTALYIGSDSPSVDLAHYGADKIVHAQHELLSSYSAEGFAAQCFSPRFARHPARRGGGQICTGAFPRTDTSAGHGHPGRRRPETGAHGSEHHRFRGEGA